MWIEVFFVGNSSRMTFEWTDPSTEFLSSVPIFFSFDVSYILQRPGFFERLNFPDVRREIFFHISTPVLLSSINFEMIFNFVV